ncbi:MULTISPECIES: ABC transporter permease [unclassified Arthrobacter]|uniref:ABC transporter permease n=1 Tax=unclassified Arthrobacter TaxID=235627 RepID=UPI001E4C63ED|nr:MULTISPECIES: ABC transporter permease [unclassified Arthrobacter]MCC9144070.1 ABC transporter permease [Arthrobacter sp. zg-Y919]MDK1275295.1 ABC transporter permease [Arthrobacter sp. zg.Y919]WIB03310.1 ABC transporter permease [Arthrobacter sp. zg-Y919]
MSTQILNPDTPVLGYWSGVRSVFSLEMKQRLRSRSWYVLLIVWFVVIGLVATLTALSSSSSAGPRGPVLYELILGFILFFGLLLAPALSANAVNGDRAAGTLAILQVTLLRPGQILAGKWLASWVASLGFLVASIPFLLWALALGGVRPLSAVVALVMLGVELGIVCAVGVGVSALAARPLFSIVVTYMLVAMLGLGTLITFGLSTFLTEGKLQATAASYANTGTGMGEVTCTGELTEITVAHTERIAWILAPNPFVVVADSIPVTPQSDENGTNPSGVMEGISYVVRLAQAGPEYTTECLNGEPRQGGSEPDVPPIWPLGLTLQAALAALLVFLGRRKLRTPVRNLAAGTRIA